MTSLLSVENLSKRFGGLQAVADVSLDVTSGEICSVIGPNGAGKTTLFNMISGVLRPSGGRILFDGTDLATVSPSRFAGIGIGRTFQNLALFKHGTVVENILTGRHTHLRSNVLEAELFFGRTRREEIVARQQVVDMIEFLEIEHCGDAFVGSLSYGQQYRVELASALACVPKLLLLDDLVSGMNAHTIATGRGGPSGIEERIAHVRRSPSRMTQTGDSRMRTVVGQYSVRAAQSEGSAQPNSFARPNVGSWHDSDLRRC